MVKIDHVIWEVGSIVAAVADLRGRGYPEAWPIGPFWPGALTAGIGLGAFNLELLEPLEREPVPGLSHVVFSAEDEAEALAWLRVPAERFEKIESSPALLRMRGFSRASGPQRLCLNFLPGGRWFVCLYEPGLRARLDPARSPVPVSASRVRVPAEWHVPEIAGVEIGRPAVTMEDGSLLMIKG
jgi:hypothetical protein